MSAVCLIYYICIMGSGSCKSEVSLFWMNEEISDWIWKILYATEKQFCSWLSEGKKWTSNWILNIFNPWDSFWFTLSSSHLSYNVPYNGGLFYWNFNQFEVIIFYCYWMWIYVMESHISIFIKEGKEGDFHFFHWGPME